jgi:hypothetical protein
MTPSPPGFFARLVLAFRCLTDSRLAAQLLDPTIAPTPAPPALQATPPDSALQLLGLLQQEGRLVDFLQEDVQGYSDAEIGSAVRVVHEGCNKVLERYLSLEPISEQNEGASITLESGFDASAWRLSGNVVGDPPFTGSLAHRGWRVSHIELPRVSRGHDVRILAPAEVEL